MRSNFRKFGVKISDAIARFVGTWTFVFIYTAAMAGWIILHKLGFLNFDSPDFIKWNLWLSYFAGTQASIILMSSERDKMREWEKLKQINQRLQILDEIIDDFIAEAEEKSKGE